jgi:CRP-like cAMP-binding protein
MAVLPSADSANERQLTPQGARPARATKAGPGAAATHLKPVELKHEAVLFEAGDKIDRVYFPHSGIISLVVELAGGETVEAAMIGRWRRRSSANGCGASAC